MKFVESKIKGLLRRKSKKSRSIGEGGSGEESTSSRSGSSHSLSSFSKSPVETPKSVLSYSAASSSCNLKMSVAQPDHSEIVVCLEDEKGKQTPATTNGKGKGFLLPTTTSTGTGFMLPTATSGMDELREVFKVFDADGDGKITKSELGCVLRSLGDDLSEEELALMVQAADKDGDGCIDLQEFISLNTVDAADATAIAACEGIFPATDDLKDAFRIFDADMDGKISAQELHKVLTSLGDAECTIDDCRQMIRGVDKDGDGFVDFQDFRRMMTTMC